jgi:hypothetical protein
LYIGLKFKTKISLNFVIFGATKKVEQKLVVAPSLLLLFLDRISEIGDPGWIKFKIRDKHPGSATQH